MSNMNVTVWVLAKETSGDSTEVEVFATLDEANQRGEEIAKAAWADSNFDCDPFPSHWQNALEKLREDDGLGIYLDITHHDLDAVAVMRTLQKPVGAAA